MRFKLGGSYVFLWKAKRSPDDHAARLSFEISQKIQTDMTYPGQVKVTVIRETRAVNVAKIRYLKVIKHKDNPAIEPPTKGPTMGIQL